MEAFFALAKVRHPALTSGEVSSTFSKADTQPDGEANAP
jgi:hypothetical protein